MQQHPLVVTDRLRIRRDPSRVSGLARWFLAPLLMLGGLQFAAAATGLTMLQDFFQKTHTITARFSQEVANHDGQVVKHASGRLWISRPGKFRWDYDGRNGQTIVSNGEKVWFYEPALEQATVQPLGKAIGSTPAALIAGNDDLSQRFRITDLGEKDGLRWLLLHPKTGQDQGFTALRLGFDAQGALREMRMEDAFQQQTVLHFEHIRINHPISVQEFQFTPPAGVDVLSQ
ncbi:MAG: outer membrane lipoprotein chaperone LolA [Gammaproteobacteria bacterium]|nr:outer membrane lipoprotein chaperone LolA [Gammaproteobacteria bacterium]